MRFYYLVGWGLLARAAHGQTVADPQAPDLPPPAATELEAARRVSSQVDSTGSCTETLRWGGAAGLVRTYYPSGQLKRYGPYANVAAGYPHGLVTTWYKNGQLGSKQPFVQGLREGQLVLYYENGQLKRQTQYVAGAELPGTCFDATGLLVPYFPYEQLPLYPGGQQQLTKEINKALRWPRNVPPLLGRSQREVCISFWVGENGEIQRPQVAVSSRLPSLDQAVLAAVSKLARHFAPARRDGVAVPSQYFLPVRFEGVAYYSRPEKI